VRLLLYFDFEVDWLSLALVVVDILPHYFVWQSYCIPVWVEHVHTRVYLTRRVHHYRILDIYQWSQSYTFCVLMLVVSSLRVVSVDCVDSPIRLGYESNSVD